MSNRFPGTSPVSEFLLSFLKIIYIYIYSRCCCAGSLLLYKAFPSCGECGLLVLALHRLLVLVVSFVVAWGLEGMQASVAVARGLSSCSS